MDELAELGLFEAHFGLINQPKAAATDKDWNFKN